MVMVYSPKMNYWPRKKDRVEKMFINFDTNDDGKLSRKELITLRQFMKKRISELNNN